MSLHPSHVVFLKVTQDWEVADETFTVPLGRRKKDREGIGSIKWDTEEAHTAGVAFLRGLACKLPLPTFTITLHSAA